MKLQEKAIQDLLALKRHECQNESYWQDFIREFHQRQRQQVIPQTAVAGWWQSIASWFEAIGPSKWAYGAGLAYAGLMVAFLVSPRGVDHEPAPATPIRYEVVPEAEIAPVLEPLILPNQQPSEPSSEDEHSF
ncbi:MAG: hypothetical protein EAZ42_06005 [Verrucomicrobia bacterium]|nr:MAG: hypothetical protein EAZ42_06005 [Verrucomicrobiota bacterium]